MLVKRMSNLKINWIYNPHSSKEKITLNKCLQNELESFKNRRRLQ